MVYTDTPSPVPPAKAPTLGSNSQMPRNSLKESALDGVSVLALGFARDLSHPGAEQATPSPQLDAQPAQQDPSAEGQGG